MPEDPTGSTIATRLLAWLPSVRRDLPWRRRRDPYAVWVSEIMLQQTQAATVVPYFERWMSHFPNVAVLAAAPLEAVLKAWEGLGYYARARNLHAAAFTIVAKHGGQVPADPAALRALPGVGRYTAGAILSLAYGQREPVLDGNVRRVLCRVYDIAQDPSVPAVEERLWALARAVVEAAPEGMAGEVNEALMELGALVCVPGRPDCPACPLASGLAAGDAEGKEPGTARTAFRDARPGTGPRAVCLAFARGTQAERPVTARRLPTPHYVVATAVIVDTAGRYLIARRPAAGLLGGLWEFPSTPAGAGGTGQRPDETLADFLVRSLQERLGLRIAVETPVLQVKHGFTHFRITLHAYRCAWGGGEAQALAYYTAVRWASPAELTRYAFPVTQRKILQALNLL